MINVVQTLPFGMQAIFVEIVGVIDHELLVALQTTEEPTRAQRVAVENILCAEFCRNLQPDSEPTERGKLIDDTLGAFLLRWPIEGEATS